MFFGKVFLCASMRAHKKKKCLERFKALVSTVSSLFENDGSYMSVRTRSDMGGFRWGTEAEEDSLKK